MLYIILLVDIIQDALYNIIGWYSSRCFSTLLVDIIQDAGYCTVIGGSYGHVIRMFQ